MRRADRERLGLQGVAAALFMGSGHKPNVDAVRAILRFAPDCADFRFLIMGSACGPFVGQLLPPNVGMMGEVDEDTKDATLAVVDCALNPMSSGSGTNVKMLDYFAAGVPVISTGHGARGLAVSDGVHLCLSEIDGFPAALRRFREDAGGAAQSGRVAAARRLVQERYDWCVIAERYRHAIETAGL